MLIDPDHPLTQTTLSKSAKTFRQLSIYWLALGGFAVGTEAFVISAILPDISADLAVSIQATGDLVAVFAFTYALSSPILTALTGAFDRRKLLMWSMAAFAGANVCAAIAPGYQPLVIARVLLAVCAGLYMPSANALAGALVPPERRGRALASVAGGTSLAVALGVPLGAYIGTRFGWRMTFVGVAVLSIIALLGLLLGLRNGIGSGLPSTNLRDRLAVIRIKGVPSTLMTTTLWATGGYTVYTYLAPYLMAVSGIEPHYLGYLYFVYGAAAFLGLLAGGAASDRVGPARVIGIKLGLLATALVSLSVWARFLTPTQALVPVLISMIFWAFNAWGFLPTQQSRLIGIAGLKTAPVILSLNASFMYLGFSMGAALGSFTLSRGSVADLGWVGALSVLASLSLFWATRYRSRIPS